MWFVRAQRGNTEIKKLAVPEGHEAAIKIKELLEKYKWKDVEVFSDDK
jgi:hypothetical protein